MSFSALGLFGGLALTGAGIAGVAGWSAWLAAAGLTLLGLVGMKEAILWRWRREQERTKLRAIAEAIAGERDDTKRAIAEAIAGERERAERALAGALAQERSGRSLVDVHLADRGLPLRRILLLFTVHRSGSTWLFDMLRTHPAIRVEPTTRAWTALGIDGWRCRSERCPGSLPDRSKFWRRCVPCSAVP